MASAAPGLDAARPFVYHRAGAISAALGLSDQAEFSGCQEWLGITSSARRGQVLREVVQYGAHAPIVVQHLGQFAPDDVFQHAFASIGGLRFLQLLFDPDDRPQLRFELRSEIDDARGDDFGFVGAYSVRDHQVVEYTSSVTLR